MTPIWLVSTQQKTNEDTPPPAGGVRHRSRSRRTRCCGRADWSDGCGMALGGDGVRAEEITELRALLDTSTPATEGGE